MSVNVLDTFEYLQHRVKIFKQFVEAMWNNQPLNMFNIQDQWIQQLNNGIELKYIELKLKLSEIIDLYKNWELIVNKYYFGSEYQLSSSDDSSTSSQKINNLHFFQNKPDRMDLLRESYFVAIAKAHFVLEEYENKKVLKSQQKKN